MNNISAWIHFILQGEIFSVFSCYNAQNCSCSDAHVPTFKLFTTAVLECSACNWWLSLDSSKWPKDRNLSSRFDKYKLSTCWAPALHISRFRPFHNAETISVENYGSLNTKLCSQRGVHEYENNSLLHRYIFRQFVKCQYSFSHLVFR